MELVYPWGKLVETAAIFLNIAVDRFPLRDRIFLIEKTRLDYLLPVFLFAQARFFGHRRCTVQSDRPRKLPRPLFLMPPIHKRFECLPAHHYSFAVDTLERVRVFLGEQEDRMVYLVDETLEVFPGEEFDLFVGGVLVKVARDADITALVAMLIVWSVMRKHVPACVHDRIAHSHIERLGGFRRGNPHDLSLLNSLPAAERKIDEHIGVLF